MFRSRLAITSHIVAVCGALATIALIAARPVEHDDNFLHMRTGEIVASTWHVPTTDPFTHTVTGAPWTSHEWGYGLLLHAVHSTFGFGGLVGLTAALLTAIFLLLYGEMWHVMRPERRALCAPLLLLGLFAALPSCVILRAALITSLGNVLLLRLLRRYREDESIRHPLAILALMLVWANMHAGVTFGLVVIALHAAQSVWDFGLRERRSKRAVLLLPAAAAVTLVNPNGVELWLFPLRVNKLFYASGLTYSMGQYNTPRLSIYPAFYLLLALTLFACLPLERIRQTVRAKDSVLLARALGTGLFLVLALRGNRFILDFVIFALPFCAQLWGQAESPTWAKRRVWLESAALCIVVGVFAVTRPSWPDPMLGRDTPTAVADFIESHGLEGRMFNFENHGGYLGWRLHQPVYWDGRNDIFFPVAWEYAHRRDLGELIEKHQLDMLILNPGYDEGFRSYLNEHRNEWGLVFWNDVASLYLKRVPKFATVLANEYKLLQPFSMPDESAIAQLGANPKLQAAVEREVDRLLAQSEDNVYAWYLRGRLAELRGDTKRRFQALARAATLSPLPLVVHQLSLAAGSLSARDRVREQ